MFLAAEKSVFIGIAARNIDPNIENPVTFYCQKIALLLPSGFQPTTHFLLG